MLRDTYGGYIDSKRVLVTGGSGFVGIHTIVQLLEKGYAIRTTIRSASKKNEVLQMLRNAGIPKIDKVEFIEADLMNDDNWYPAVDGCDYVMHIASPIFLRLPKHEDDMIRPAVEGTLRVLAAAKKTGVKRVVMTSNYGAVGYSVKDPDIMVTEEYWTDVNEPGLAAYNKSKLLAEHAAWDFIKKDGGTLELSVINPAAIFGPALGPSLSSGAELLRKIMSGSAKALPSMRLGIVDVRDVADLHIRAMVSDAASSQRFLAVAGGTMSLREIALLLKAKMPNAAKRTYTKTLPNWIIKLAALFNAESKALAPMLTVNRNASNAKAQKLLGWHPRTNEEAILATAEMLVKFGHVKEN